MVDFAHGTIRVVRTELTCYPSVGIFTNKRLPWCMILVDYCPALTSHQMREGKARSLDEFKVLNPSLWVSD